MGQTDPAKESPIDDEGTFRLPRRNGVTITVAGAIAILQQFPPDAILVGADSHGSEGMQLGYFEPIQIQPQEYGDHYISLKVADQAEYVSLQFWD